MTHRTTDPKIVTAADLKNRRDPDTGRFLPADTRTTVTRLDTPPPAKIPEIGAGLAQALLDADVEAWRIRQIVQTSERLISAIEFGDRIGAGS